MTNPLLSESTLPYGLPDFAVIEPWHYEEAILSGLDDGLVALDSIVNSSEPPTAANTLEPLERLQWGLHPIIGPFFQLLWAEGTPEIEEINLRIAPKLAAAHDEILMNRKLYDRLMELASCHSARSDNVTESQNLDWDASEHRPALSDTQFLLKNWLKNMRRAGVTLDDAAQSRLREINTELTELQAQFGNRLLAGNKAAAVLVTNKAELAGLDDDAIAAFADAAADQGLDGWLISLELTTGQQVLSRLENPDLRARIMSAAQSRGLSDDENDTKDLITKTAKLRAEHAQLLGYPHHAAYVADNNVIETTEAVAELLGQLAAPAMENAKQEAAQLAGITLDSATTFHSAQNDGKYGHMPAEPSVSSSCTSAEREDAGPPTPIKPSDWTFLAEQLMRDRFNFDFAQLRPYLELQTVLHQGVFKAAHELYGLNFVPRPDLKGYHPDVEVYEVFDDDKPQIKNQGRGLIMFDFYARPTKRGGAWMNLLIGQSYLMGQKPVVTQTLNIVKPAAGEPTLITWDNVKTLFHEFGHALHGLLSDTYYPSQSSPYVPTDFVEYPSQVNEMWSHDPEMLSHFAKHHETGEPMPTEWYNHLKDTKEFGEGRALLETLGANAIDQAWHRLTPEEVPTPDQVEAFEKAALEKAGVYFEAVPPRYRSTYYNHIWSSGYSAGYYAYMLSKMFDADTVTWFKENGGLRRENGQKFAKEVLSKGNTRDAKESFRALRGRDVIIQPLLVRLGLASE